MINIRMNLRQLEVLDRNLTRFVARIPDIVAGEVVRQVRELSKSGVGPDGRAYPQYTKRYADRKKSGKRTPVTLRDTGAMMASVKNRGGVVTVDDSHTLIAEGLSKKRPFLEVSPITVGNVERLLLKELYAST
jgi:hypothetical protein